MLPSRAVIIYKNVNLMKSQELYTIDRSYKKKSQNGQSYPIPNKTTITDALGKKMKMKHEPYILHTMSNYT